MEGNAIVANDTLTGIANAINTKAGTSGQMTVQEMSGKIGQIMATNQTEKNAVKAAINAKNATVAPTDSISQWPTAIASIPGVPEGTFVLTGSATSVEYTAFSSRTYLTEISLPYCTLVKTSAFSSCTALNTVLLPKCTDIQQSAFFHCSSLVTVLLPICLDIGSTTFRECTSLTTLSLPSCTNIGKNAFLSCTSLTSLNLQSLTVSKVTAGASGWAIPSGCVVQCKDGTYTQQ